MALPSTRNRPNGTAYVGARTAVVILRRGAARFDSGVGCMWNPKPTDDPGITVFVADGKIKICVDGTRNAAIPFDECGLAKSGRLSGIEAHADYLQSELGKVKRELENVKRLLCTLTPDT